VLRGMAWGVQYLERRPPNGDAISLADRTIGVYQRVDFAGHDLRACPGGQFAPAAYIVIVNVRFQHMRNLDALEEEAQGTLTLALVGTLASTQLISHLQAFHAAYPRVRLLLCTARSDEVSTQVRQGDALLGLRYFADPRPDTRSLHVMDEPLQVVCAAHSRFVTGTPTEPAALQGVPWFSFPRKTGSAGEALAQLLEQQLLRHDLQSAERIVIDSLTAQKRLIEADFGIGLLPESSIEEELRLGTVRILPITALQTVQPVVLIFRRQAYLSRAARLLLKALVPQADLSNSSEIAYETC
jgi:DNA-binding transcriptional LysR family regulator